MRILIGGVGRMKSGPEAELFAKYLERSRKAGRGIGISAIDLIELGESREATSALRKEAEAEAILSALPEPEIIVALDESGASMGSAEFAEFIRQLSDRSVSVLAFALGGPDGHGSALLKRSARKLAFGAMTWPHRLARVMLAEQIYRAITILSSHPYHRR